MGFTTVLLLPSELVGLASVSEELKYTTFRLSYEELPQRLKVCEMIIVDIIHRKETTYPTTDG